MMIRRQRFHRVLFAVAGMYNVLWGLLSALFPQWLFRFAQMSDLNHEALFACLGMVIGVYGLLYMEVARAPERGFPIAAVGLLGKVLGPVGLVVLVATGAWPWRAGVMCLTNDLVWWLPFTVYLTDAWPAYRQTYAPTLDQGTTNA